MPRPKVPSDERKAPPAAERDRLEIIRFDTEEAQRQAISALIDYGMLNLTSYSLEEWLVRTPVARKLRELGVPFQWLTEHV